MKDGIHPEYRPVVFHDVSADFKVLTRSTATSKQTIKWDDGNEYPVIRFDLSSASHAFYTGRDQQVSDRGGRIEQFRQRYAKQIAAAEAKAAAEGQQAEASSSAEEEASTAS